MKEKSLFLPQNRCSKDGIGGMKGAVGTDEPLVPLLSQEDLRVSLGLTGKRDVNHEGK